MLTGNNQSIDLMETIRFVHTSDLHLDTPFKGLSQLNTELAKRLKGAGFNTFSRIVDICLDEKVDFLIISGDTFDGEIKSLAAQLGFVSELKRLSEKSIPTYIVCGNHDPLESWLSSLQLPEHVYRFGSSEVETVSYERDGRHLATIGGISFQSKEEDNNLAINYHLNANTGDSAFSIAILHGTVGTPGLHKNHAPFRLDDIHRKGFDYWALGHIHKRQVVKERHPAVVYPGNPQGRDFGETGCKGCCLIEITPHQAPEINFLPAQMIRFEEIAIDLTGEDSIDVLTNKLEEAIRNLKDVDPLEIPFLNTNKAVNYRAENKTSYMLRLTLTGRTPLHNQLVRPGEICQLQEHFNNGQLNRECFVWIDRIDLTTQNMLDVEEMKHGKDFIAEVLTTIAVYEKESDKLTSIINDAEAVFGSMEAKRELQQFSVAEQKDILDRAKWMLLDQLIQEVP